MNLKELFNKAAASQRTRRFIYCVCAAVIIISVGVIIKNVIDSNNRHASATDFYFDTVVSIEIYDSNASVSAKSLIDTCMNMCSTYDSMFDMYNEESEIYKINSSGGNHVSVSEDTIGLLNVGKYFGELTDGLFDITIGSVSKLWDFESENSTLPSEEDISNALANVNYKAIILYYDVNEVLVDNAGAQIDVGAIAKGYVSDKIKTYLEEQGVTSAMINLGGNVELIGTKTDGTDFTIGIQKPFAEDGKTIATIDVSDMAIVTSGVYQRYFYGEDDTLYNHILSPETGYPIDNGLLSVTVIADSGIDGDGLSTSAMLMGLEDGMALVEEYINAEAIFITTDNEIVLSSGLEQNGDTITFKSQN